MSDDIKIGDRFYPTDDPAAVYTVSAVSRFGHRITHIRSGGLFNDTAAAKLGL